MMPLHIFDGLQIEQFGFFAHFYLAVTALQYTPHNDTDQPVYQFSLSE